MDYRPSIGITIHGRNDKGRFDVNAKYVDSVRRAGGYPVLLPPGETRPEECFEFLDGIVMTGGPDIAPVRYGGKMHPEVYGVDLERDASEFELVRAIIAAKKPTLCICRGMQVLNVALGGTLFEHVPDEFGTRVVHRNGNTYEMHDVTIEAGSHLAEIVGATHVPVASWHHQALRKLAPGLVTVATSADGVIEAVEHEDHDDLVAVQWHPEHTAAEDERQQALFDALVRTLRGDD